MKEKIKKAKLIKRITDDGLIEVHDHIPLGKIYMVDLSTRRMADGYNVDHNVYWTKEVINLLEGGWFPTEILEIEDNGLHNSHH